MTNLIFQAISFAVKAHEILETADADILLIKCADLLDNLQTSVNDKIKNNINIWQKLNHSQTDLQWYYSSLLKIFEKRIIQTEAISMVNGARAIFQRLFDETIS